MVKNTVDMLNPGLVYTEMILDQSIGKISEVRNMNDEEFNEYMSNNVDKLREKGD